MKYLFIEVKYNLSKRWQS